MGRPSKYQSSTESDWYGLHYRMAVPAQVKDGRWSTRVYLLTPDKKSLNHGGILFRSRKGETQEDLIRRVQQNLPDLIAEYTDTILAAVRSGTWPGMTLKTYVALRGAAIQNICKWAGKAKNHWTHWKKRLCPAVGNLELHQCTDFTLIESKIEDLTHRKRNKRGYTDLERTDWIILGDILDFAVRVDGLLADNSLRSQARKCREKMSTIASKDLARRDLTEEEVASLLEQCLAHRGTAIYDAMILQVLTGLTVPELCALDVGDWQQGNAVSWLEITKAYQQERGKPPVMTKLLDDANNYRRVVCTRAVEQLLRRLMDSHRGKSRADRSTPLFLTSEGVRLSPEAYKAATHDVLDKIILDGAQLSFPQRRSILRGAGRPTVSHTDLLRATAAYYIRTVCRCNDAEQSALLGYRQAHTYARSYVDWTNELVLLYLRNKLERWHGAILCTDAQAEKAGQCQRADHLVVMAQPYSHLEIHTPHGLVGLVQKREGL